MMRLTKKSLEEFRAEAEMQYPKEACALVVMNGRKQQVIPCNNDHEKPEDYFSISGQAWADAEDIGQVVMLLHSHTGDGSRPIASDMDVQQCGESGITWGILALPSGEYAEIEPESPPLVGRPFILGSWDCFGLIIDWHRQQGVELKDRRLTYPWWQEIYPENLYADFWEEDGFVECEPCPGAMVVMQVSSTKWNHAGIITEDGKLLHHLYGQQSCIIPYERGYFKDRTVLACRHKDLPLELKPWQ